MVAVTETTQLIPIGTRLKARPFVARDGMIRLEALVAKSTGHLDSHGIPQTNTIQISTNVMVPDGGTVAMCNQPRTEIKQNRCPMPLLSCIPGPLSLLSLIPYSDSLLPSTDYVMHKQLIVLLSARVYKQ